MGKRLVVSLVFAVEVFGAGAFAVALPPTGQSGEGLSASAQPTPPASTTLMMRGTIDKYDASTRVLTLSTPNGTLQLPLASTARIRQGRDRIDALALEKLAGHRAAVRYSESGGSKTAESIHVFGKNERTE